MQENVGTMGSVNGAGDGGGVVGDPWVIEEEDDDRSLYVSRPDVSKTISFFPPKLFPPKHVPPQHQRMCHHSTMYRYGNITETAPLEMPGTVPQACTFYTSTGMAVMTAAEME